MYSTNNHCYKQNITNNNVYTLMFHINCGLNNYEQNVDKIKYLSVWTKHVLILKKQSNEQLIIYNYKYGHDIISKIFKLVVINYFKHFNNKYRFDTWVKYSFFYQFPISDLL